MKLKGGAIIGKGTYGEVHTFEMTEENPETKKLKIVFVQGTQIQYKTLKDGHVITYKEYIQKFIDDRFKDAVYKKFISPPNNPLTNIDLQREADKEIELLKQLHDVPNNIVFKYDNGRILTDFVYNDDPSRVIYKRMDGNLYEMPVTKHMKTSLLSEQLMYEGNEFLNGLHAKRLCHHDIKPANILYKFDNTTQQFSFAVGDYGMVKDDHEHMIGTYGWQLPHLLMMSWRTDDDIRDWFIKNGQSYISQKKLGGLDFEVIVERQTPRIRLMTTKEELYKLNDRYALGLSAYQTFHEYMSDSERVKFLNEYVYFTLTTDAEITTSNAAACIVFKSPPQRSRRLRRKGPHQPRSRCRRRCCKKRRRRPRRRSCLCCHASRLP